MKGVLLAGGTGSRLRPITHTGSKHLVPVANKPVLEYAVEDLRDAGITEIGVVLGNKGRKEIQRLIGDGSRYGVDITYIVQGDPLGLAHAVGCARDFVGNEKFVMYLGDNMLKQGIQALIERFTEGDYHAGIALHPVENPTAFGVAELNGDGKVIRLVEKPDDPPSDLALVGIYLFSPVVFDVIEDLEPSWRGELEITEALQRLIEDGRYVDSHVIEGWWKDTGKPEDILEANRFVLDGKNGEVQGKVGDGAEITGNVDLAPSAVVESGAVVRGPVSIAADAVIRGEGYIGPYTSIGPNTMVEKAHIENSVIVGDAEITTNGRIVDSLVGRSTKIGNGQRLVPDGRRLIVGNHSEIKL